MVNTSPLALLKISSRAAGLVAAQNSASARRSASIPSMIIDFPPG